MNIPKEIYLNSDNKTVQLWEGKFEDWAIFAYNICCEYDTINPMELSNARFLENCLIGERKQWSSDQCKALYKIMKKIKDESMFEWDEPVFTNFVSSLRYCAKQNRSVQFKIV